jgi:hypothetical protein
MEARRPNDTRAPLLVGTSTPLLVLALAVYGMRMRTRMVPVNILGWDDYTISLAVVSF